MAARGPARPRLADADPAGRQIKMLGSLPVACSFCRRLGIAAIIDDLVRIRDVAAVTAGQAAEAMICYRLTSPAPLLHVGDWARTWAVPEVLGIPALALNDDKLGRTLDAIAPHLDQITSAVAVRAIGAFDTGISQLHWDMTSFCCTAPTTRPMRTTRRPATATPKTAARTCCRCRPGSRPPATTGSRSTTAPTTAVPPRCPR